MNLGQVLETHLGWASKLLGFRATSPVFDGARDQAIEDALSRIWFAQRAGAIDPTPTINSPRLDEEKLEQYLTQRGYNASAILDDANIGAASEACLRVWLQEEAEVQSTGLSFEEMREEVARLHRDQRMAPPIFGKVPLFDGRTGESFDQPVAVGCIYMLKLIHLWRTRFTPAPPAPTR